MLLILYILLQVFNKYYYVKESRDFTLLSKRFIVPKETESFWIIKPLTLILRFQEEADHSLQTLNLFYLLQWPIRLPFQILQRAPPPPPRSPDAAPAQLCRSVGRMVGNCSSTNSSSICSLLARLRRSHSQAELPKSAQPRGAPQPLGGRKPQEVLAGVFPGLEPGCLGARPSAAKTEASSFSTFTVRIPVRSSADWAIQNCFPSIP